jgi:2-haloacid dehalogenase
MSDLGSPRAQLITFDLNGTLIDWERSLRRYITGVLAKKGSPVEPHFFYDCWYERHHLPMVAAPFQPYGALLQASLQAAFRVFCIDVDSSDGADFAAAMASCEPFHEAPRVLQALSARYALGVISNNEPALIANPIARLGNPFRFVVTAAEAGAYKPDARPFELMLETAKLRPEQIVHVAQSQWADLPRSLSMGIRTIWINRKQQPLHSGCPTPDAELPDLCDLPSLLMPED